MGPRSSGPYSHIRAYYQSWNSTRQQFADTLHVLGAVAEHWLQTLQAQNDENDVEYRRPGELEVRYWVDTVIYDWRAHREWQWAQIVASFPTWVKLGRLEMDYSARE